MNRFALLAALALAIGTGGCAGVPSASPTAAESGGPSASASASASLEPPLHNPAAVVEGEPYQPAIDPADFVAVIDNPYFPLIPGTTHVFEGAGEHVEVTVTTDTKVIMGVTCVVIHDQVLVDGEVAEDTYDWYAQDRWGNVWYFGEDTAEYEHGVVTTTAGSFEAGVNGAQPGILMLGAPQVGDYYWEEFYAGEAEDQARVTSLAEMGIEVPYGRYDQVLMTENTTPLEPGLIERKWYASGIGVIAEELLGSGEGQLVLVEVRVSS